MPTRIAIFEGARKQHRRGRRKKSYSGTSFGRTRQQSKFKGCAVKCKGGKKYRSCMKVCLRKK